MGIGDILYVSVIVLQMVEANLRLEIIKILTCTVIEYKNYFTYQSASYFRPIFSTQFNDFDAYLKRRKRKIINIFNKKNGKFYNNYGK